jgi:hypothetical protein
MAFLAMRSSGVVNAVSHLHGEEDLQKVTNESLWKFRMEKTQRLVDYVRERLAWQLVSVSASGQLIKQCRQLLDPIFLPWVLPDASPATNGQICCSTTPTAYPQH